MHSTTLYNLCTAGYVASLALFGAHLVKTRKLILKLGVLFLAISFLVQTGGMILRWAEAGFLEVGAAELSLGRPLTGWAWFVTFTQHPPWSNLYEIMIYMSWGIVLVTLAAEIKWQFAWVRQIGVILALMSLGMAALTDSAISPLVPALKSWWIMIHVISASIAYAAGAIAAFLCLFALLKDDVRVKKNILVSGYLFFMAVLLFALTGGFRLFIEQSFFVKLLAVVGENSVKVQDLAQENPQDFLVPMPFLGPIFMSAILSHLLSAFFIYRRSDISNSNCKKFMLANFFLVLLALVLVFFHGFNQTSIEINADFMHHLSPAGPWFIGFKSHPWSLALLILVAILEGLFVIFLLRPDLVRKKLPTLDALELSSYKSISLSFFLMTLVLITGALWAHYAWGRYWAWDPKETGALAIWLNYAIFLHARRTKGLSGPKSSLIGILGFFIIIIGFLGVNLGLFADGLHTYGNG